MENLLFQADFRTWNLSVLLNYFFWPEFEDVLRWQSLTIPFFDLLINLRLVLQFDHILSAQTQTSIFSSLLFQKNSSMTLSTQTRIPFIDSKYSILLKNSSRTCLERSVLEVSLTYKLVHVIRAIVKRLLAVYIEYHIRFLYMQGNSLRASSPIWASEASLARTSRVLARLV